MGPGRGGAVPGGVHVEAPRPALQQVLAVLGVVGGLRLPIGPEQLQEGHQPLSDRIKWGNHSPLTLSVG
jgi:hypothetical protein